MKRSWNRYEIEWMIFKEEVTEALDDHALTIVGLCIILLSIIAVIDMMEKYG